MYYRMKCCRFTDKMKTQTLRSWSRFHKWTAHRLVCSISISNNLVSYFTCIHLFIFYLLFPSFTFHLMHSRSVWTAEYLFYFFFFFFLISAKLHSVYELYIIAMNHVVSYKLQQMPMNLLLLREKSHNYNGRVLKWYIHRRLLPGLLSCCFFLLFYKMLYNYLMAIIRMCQCRHTYTCVHCVQ